MDKVMKVDKGSNYSYAPESIGKKGITGIVARFIMMTIFLYVAFLSCGKPNIIIDRAYLFKLGVSGQSEKEFGEKMKELDSMTQTTEVHVYGDREKLLKALLNKEVDGILTGVPIPKRDDIDYYPVYQDRKNYNVTYIVYRKDIPNFIFNDYKWYGSTNKEYAEEKKDKLSFFNHRKEWDSDEWGKILLDTFWELVNIDGQEVKESKPSTKVKDMKGGSGKAFMLTIGKGVFGTETLNGKKYSGKYSIEARKITMEIEGLNEGKKQEGSGKPSIKGVAVTGQEIQGRYLNNINGAEIVNLIDDNTLYIGRSDGKGYLVFRKYK